MAYAPQLARSLGGEPAFHHVWAVIRRRDGFVVMG